MNTILDLIDEVDTQKDLNDKEMTQVVEKMVTRFDSKPFQTAMLNDMKSRFEAGRARALQSIRK